jgi:hypothetical protein
VVDIPISFLLHCRGDFSGVIETDDFRAVIDPAEKLLEMEIRILSNISTNMKPY